MLFHVRMTDYPVSRRTPELRDRHRQYFDDHADCFIARGATHGDDGGAVLSSVIYVELPDRAAAERFIAEEPNNKAGVYMNVEIFRWSNPLNRRQRDFPRRDGQVLWYIRGYAKPGAHARREALLAAHQAYFQPYDAAHFVVRGGVLDEDGRTWLGSANLIALPDRNAALAFAAEEPFCKNGLFERVLIERYSFGGRPGQVT
jgi:uncharacterized protein